MLMGYYYTILLFYYCYVERMEKNEREKWEGKTMSFYPENTRNRYKGGNKFRTPPSRGLSK